MSVFNNKLEFELRKVNERNPDRNPYGLPVLINGEPITVPVEKAQEMFVIAISEDARPCEFDGTVYRIGHFILVPENSGL